MIPKWETQVLKEVNRDEKDKMGMRIYIMGQRNFSLATNATTKTSTFVEVVKDEKWRKAMGNEYVAMIKNLTWKIVDCPQAIKPIGYKWVYLRSSARRA
jgi:hypothetical protein